MNFDTKIDNYQNEIINTTIQLISFKSVYDEDKKDIYPYGKENHEALTYFLSMAESDGFKTKNINDHVGFIEYGQGAEMIAILVHLDVVPAGSGWSQDAFTGYVKDGKLFGRGSSDDKGPSVATYYALKAIKDAGIQLSKRVRIIVGIDEETDFRCMEEYIKHEEIPSMCIVPDADFPVTNCEKGLLNFVLQATNSCNETDPFTILSLSGGERSNVVASSCTCQIQTSTPETLKSLFSTFLVNTGYTMELLELKHSNNTYIYEIVSYGVLAHASVPELGKNAILQMMQFINTLGLSHGLGMFAKFMTTHIHNETSGKSLQIAFKDTTGHLTLNVGTLTFDNQVISVECDIRYPISFQYLDIIAKIEAFALQYNVTIRNIRDIPPMFVDPNSKLVTSLLQVYGDFMNIEARPVSIGFGTYSRVFKNSVGFGPNFPWEEKVAHQSDEHISVKSLLDIAKLYARAIYFLATEAS